MYIQVVSLDKGNFINNYINIYIDKKNTEQVMKKLQSIITDMINDTTCNSINITKWPSISTLEELIEDF